MCCGPLLPVAQHLVDRGGGACAGVYRRDMFHGRADLAEPWRMPHSWETGTGEVTAREMSGVRLVLSRHGFSLLPSTASATFLCMQVWGPGSSSVRPIPVYCVALAVLHLSSCTFFVF